MSSKQMTNVITWLRGSRGFFRNGRVLQDEAIDLSDCVGWNGCGLGALVLMADIRGGRTKGNEYGAHDR
jgi:hypothetical protein